MRTTLNLNDALMEEAAARLAALGGKDPKAAAAPRRKTAKPS